ncbi:MAG: helix-turn-helix domain-containing protein [Dehalococcoidia bacterium]
MDEWNAMLLDARKSIGLSRPAVAALAGVSAQTVKAYELGLRRPSRQLLVGILDVLAVDRMVRNQILLSAGFAPDGELLGPHNPDYMFTSAEAVSLISTLPWPAHVQTELMEVIAANRLAQRLWGVDLDREFHGAVERNLITFATNPRFADRILNWEETATVAVGALKGHHRGSVLQPEAATAYFGAVLDRVFSADPRYSRRLLDLWDRVPPRVPKIRWYYPVVWSDAELGVLRFLVSAASADEPGGLMFHEWMPTNAETWQKLEVLQSRRP